MLSVESVQVRKVPFVVWELYHLHSALDPNGSARS